MPRKLSGNELLVDSLVDFENKLIFRWSDYSGESSIEPDSEIFQCQVTGKSKL